MLLKSISTCQKVKVLVGFTGNLRHGVTKRCCGWYWLPETLTIASLLMCRLLPSEWAVPLSCWRLRFLQRLLVNNSTSSPHLAWPCQQQMSELEWTVTVFSHSGHSYSIKHSVAALDGRILSSWVMRRARDAASSIRLLWPNANWVDALDISQSLHVPHYCGSECPQVVIIDIAHIGIIWQWDNCGIFKVSVESHTKMKNT